MKKIFIAIILIIIITFIIDMNSFENKIIRKIEEEMISIDEFYIYGRYFNIKGTIPFKVDNASLVFINKDFEETTYELNINHNKFYLADKINTGINLEKIKYENYALLLRVGDKYYSFENKTNYNNAYYYTMNLNNKTNYLEFKFLKRQEKSIFYLTSKNIKTPNNIYDIVIDPGHGSSADSGAVQGNIYEKDINLAISLKLKEALEKENFKVLLTRTEDVNPSPYGHNGRAVLPNQVKAKLFISVHANSTGYQMIKGGVEIYAPSKMEYSLAKEFADNIKEYANTTYSPQVTNRVLDGVYVRTLTENDINNSKALAKANGYEFYSNITTDTPWYFYNRETGGYMTGAYMDGRNTDYPPNPYYNSNMGVEGYLLELGYMTCKNDLDNLLNNEDGYVKGIVKAIVNHFRWQKDHFWSFLLFIKKII